MKRVSARGLRRVFIVETRTGTGVSRRRSDTGLGRDPFAITQEKVLPASAASVMWGFYAAIDRLLNAAEMRERRRLPNERRPV